MPVGPSRRLGADFVIAINVLPTGDRTHCAYLQAFRSMRRRCLGGGPGELFARGGEAVEAARAPAEPVGPGPPIGYAPPMAGCDRR